MNNEFYDILDSLSEKKATYFLNKTKSEVTVENVISQVVKDISWIEMLEKSIPYIDNIVRNPRKFIVQEEELIPVERTKKVTEDSIKHLAKHTNLIQDVDENGDVMPLKLLNTFKEESTDLYENRFIHSLITNTKIFLNEFLENNSFDKSSEYLKKVSYEGKSTIPGEIIDVKLEIRNKYAIDEKEEAQTKDINQRVQNIVEIFDGFLHSQFIKSLNNVVPVRSPIRKTNVILKDVNFIKAVELWEFIETFDIKNATQIVKNSKIEEPYNLEEKIKIGSYLQYYAVNNITKKDLYTTEYKLGRDYIKKAIEMYVAEDHGNERKFRNMLISEFRQAKNKKEREFNDIKNEFKNNILRHKKRLKDSLQYLD